MPRVIDSMAVAFVFVVVLVLYSCLRRMLAGRDNTNRKQLRATNRDPSTLLYQDTKPRNRAVEGTAIVGALDSNDEFEMNGANPLLQRARAELSRHLYLAACFEPLEGRRMLAIFSVHNRLQILLASQTSMCWPQVERLLRLNMAGFLDGPPFAM